MMVRNETDKTSGETGTRNLRRLTPRSMPACSVCPRPKRDRHLARGRSLSQNSLLRSRRTNLRAKPSLLAPPRSFLSRQRSLVPSTVVSQACGSGAPGIAVKTLINTMGHAFQKRIEHAAAPLGRIRTLRFPFPIVTPDWQFHSTCVPSLQTVLLHSRQPVPFQTPV